MKDVIDRICFIKIQNYKDSILRQAIKELISENHLHSNRSQFNVNVEFHKRTKKIDFNKNTECGCKYCVIGKEYSSLMIYKHKLKKHIYGDDMYGDGINFEKKIEDVNLQLAIAKKRLMFFKDLLKL